MSTPAHNNGTPGKRTRIIELNDRLRTTFTDGRVQMTPAAHNPKRGII